MTTERRCQDTAIFKKRVTLEPLPGDRPLDVRDQLALDCQRSRTVSRARTDAGFAVGQRPGRLRRKPAA